VKITKEKDVLLYVRVMQHCSAVGLRHFNFSVTAANKASKVTFGIVSDDFEVKVSSYEFSFFHSSRYLRIRTRGS
jgi:hypothetical protein